MRRRCLRHSVMWFWLDGMNQIGKLHRILDEEYRHVITDHVPVSFVGIKLYCEATHIARGVFRTALAGHCGKAHEYGCDFSFLGERSCANVLGKRVIGFKVSVCG